MQTSRLSEKQQADLLTNLPGWSVDQETLTKQFEFKNFTEAMDFVNKVAALAEESKHHPDITISFNKVTINTTTHDANGLTEKDFSLAEQINRL